MKILSGCLTFLALDCLVNLVSDCLSKIFIFVFSAAAMQAASADEDALTFKDIGEEYGAIFIS